MATHNDYSILCEGRDHDRPFYVTLRVRAKGPGEVEEAVKAHAASRGWQVTELDELTLLAKDVPADEGAGAIEAITGRSYFDPE